MTAYQNKLHICFNYRARPQAQSSEERRCTDCRRMERPSQWNWWWMCDRVFCGEDLRMKVVLHPNRAALSLASVSHTQPKRRMTPEEPSDWACCCHSRCTRPLWANWWFLFSGQTLWWLPASRKCCLLHPHPKCVSLKNSPQSPEHRETYQISLGWQEAVSSACQPHLPLQAHLCPSSLSDLQTV